MQLVSENWEVIFSGVGTAILVFLLGIAWKIKCKRKPKDTGDTQSALAGQNSQIIQAGRDASGGDITKK